MLDLDVYLNNNYQVFFISDNHFFHSNIIKYCNRPFKDVEEMNREMIKRWNDVVGPNDIVFCLGDFCLGTKENIIEIGKQLNGTKFLIKGNHCRGTRKTYKEAGFKEVYNQGIDVFYTMLGVIHLSHYPINHEFETYDNILVNIHGHIHSPVLFDDDKPGKICVSAEATGYAPINIKEIVNLYYKNYIK
jgi:calcineurin-like phosphoesterase family protein